MKRSFALLFVIVFWPLAARAMSLYEQSVAKALSERVTRPGVTYLLIDARTKNRIASRWPGADRPVPPGSLVKLLTALAYAEGHGFKYSKFVCHGAADGCWYSPGHGRIGITQAVEYSCNAYFLHLAEHVSPEDLRAVLGQLGIDEAPANFAPGALIGLGDNWRISPEHLARAYLNLIFLSDEPGVAPLVRGMALSAQAGTASAIGRALRGAAALGKTGTAPCLHRSRAPGDGYVVALYPAESPRLLLLVCVHGVPGAVAAVTAGQILRIAVDGP